MARLYAQLATLLFLILGIGGLFLGSASPASPNAGDFEGLIMHLTWVRDAVDIIIGGVFLFVGFFASRHLGRLLCGSAGILLLALTILGFLAGDDTLAGHGFLGMYFPPFINGLDLGTGLLAVLAALGTLEDEPEPMLQRR